MCVYVLAHAHLHLYILISSLMLAMFHPHLKWLLYQPKDYWSLCIDMYHIFAAMHVSAAKSSVKLASQQLFSLMPA